LFVHSRFIENPLIDLEAINPSLLRWFCHTWRGGVGALLENDLW
jgi:hypothetical protein